MTVSLYLTTELHLENSYFLNNAANAALTPVRYFFAGKSVRIVDGACQQGNGPELERSWHKTALMIATFIPGVILGLAARCFSFAIEQVREGFALIKNDVQLVIPQPEQAIDIGLLPIESVISEEIAFFKQLLEVPDDQLHAWLEKKKSDKNYLDAFYGASVLAESKIAFEDIGEDELGELIELFQQATLRLERLELSRTQKSSTQDSSTQSSKTKIPRLPKEIPSQLLNQLRRIKGVLSDAEFDQFCSKLKHDPAHVRATLHESEQVVRIRKVTDLAIYFFLELRDVPDRKVATWLKTQRASKKYIHPFFFSADVLANQQKYEKIIGRQSFADIDYNYKEACARVTKLGLAACIADKP